MAISTFMDTIEPTVGLTLISKNQFPSNFMFAIPATTHPAVTPNIYFWEPLKKMPGTLNKKTGCVEENAVHERNSPIKRLST